MIATITRAPALAPIEPPRGRGITPAMHEAIRIARAAGGLYGRANWAGRGSADFTIAACTVRALMRAKLIKRANHQPNRAHLTERGRRYAMTYFATPATEIAAQTEVIEA